MARIVKRDRESGDRKLIRPDSARYVRTRPNRVGRTEIVHTYVYTSILKREGWGTKRIDIMPKGETKREDAPTRPRRARK